jgi:hypothetical protein
VEQVVAFFPAPFWKAQRQTTSGVQPKNVPQRASKKLSGKARDI